MDASVSAHRAGLRCGAHCAKQSFTRPQDTLDHREIASQAEAQEGGTEMNPAYDDVISSIGVELEWRAMRRNRSGSGAYRVGRLRENAGKLDRVGG